MRILAISHEFPPLGGGGANACMFLTKGFVARGYQVTLITAGFGGLPKYERINDVDVIRVSAKRKHIEHCSFVEMLSFIVKAWPVAKKKVLEAKKKGCKYDKCLVFFGIPSGVIGLGLKYKYKLPYIIRFGGGDVPGFQDRFTNIYKLIGPAIRLIWKNADKRIANSDGLRQMAYEFCDKYEFDVICNGVDTNLFKPSDSRIDRVKTQVLFVSRLIERKGLQYVIPQLKGMDNIELTIVGDGPYRNELERIVKDTELSDIVNFLGQKNKSEIVQYYQNADIFILPSAKEGMPNVVLEAMACGLPIIITPCQGAAELVDEKNGYIISVDEFGTAIGNIAGNRNLIEKMGNSSLNKAEKKFSWDRTVEEYLKLLES